MSRSNLAEVLEEEDPDCFEERDSFWRLPRVKTLMSDLMRPDIFYSKVEDSRLYLEEMGFVIQGISSDQVYYVVEPPQRWKKVISSDYFMDVYDAEGRQRITGMLFGPSLSNSLGSAFLNVIKLPEGNYTPIKNLPPSILNIVKE